MRLTGLIFWKSLCSLTFGLDVVVNSDPTVRAGDRAVTLECQAFVVSGSLTECYWFGPGSFARYQTSSNPDKNPSDLSKEVFTPDSSEVNFDESGEVVIDTGTGSPEVFTTTERSLPTKLKNRKDPGWKKWDQTELRSHESIQVKIDQDQNLCRLTIRIVTSEHHGPWQCGLKDVRSEAFKNIFVYLTVISDEDHLSILMKNEERITQAETGDKVVLKCPTNSLPGGRGLQPTCTFKGPNMKRSYYLSGL